MARTKASVGSKISSVKNSKARCSAAPTSNVVSSASSDKAARSAGGGNPVCPRETPKWQRPITNFFINKPGEKREMGAGENDEAAGSSKVKPKPKRNVIESSDEDRSPEKPKNKELDETIELDTLDGENSHKIQEYYPNKPKGKGVGKKTKEHNGGRETKGHNDEREKKGHNDEREKKGHNDEREKKGHNDVREGKDSEEESLVENYSTENEKNKTFNNIKEKENVDSNIESSKREVQNDNVKGNNIKERSKRERDDREEENVSKKIKVN